MPHNIIKIRQNNIVIDSLSFEERCYRVLRHEIDADITEQFGVYVRWTRLFVIWTNRVGNVLIQAKQ